MRVTVRGRFESGESFERRVQTPVELHLGDSFVLGPEGARMQIVGKTQRLTPQGASEPLWELAPMDARGNSASDVFDVAEAQLRGQVGAELPVLGIARRALDALVWSLERSDIAPADTEPPPTEYYIATALYFLGVIAVRAARAGFALLAAGYEPESLGQKRLLTEVHVRMQAIVGDSSGQHARQWIEGPAPSTPARLVRRFADAEVVKLYEQSIHADVEGVKNWLLQPEGERVSGLVARPHRTAAFSNLFLTEFASELRDAAVVIARLWGFPVPGVESLDVAITNAQKSYLAPSASEPEA